MKLLRVVASIVVLLTVACGGDSKSPTAPTATTPGKIISIEGSLSFGDVNVGQSKEITVTLRNAGNTVMTLSGITATGGLTNICAASPTTGSIGAGGTLAVSFRCTPTTGGPFSGTISFTTDHTGGSNTTTLNGNGVAPPVTVVGVVTNANTRAALGSVRVSAGAVSTTTDGNGFYSMVLPSGAQSISYTRDGYNSQTAAVTLTGDTRRDVSLLPFWTMSGTGNTVFDMPSYVSRVRITGTYTSNSSNFIVRVAGRLVVNELLGRAWTQTTYDGTHLLTGGVTEITNSSGVAWTFTQVQ